MFVRISQSIRRAPNLIRTRVSCQEQIRCLANDKTNHFGFQAVSDQEKFDKVYEVFDSVAKNYDLMNDFMSFGIHRYWKSEFIQKLRPYAGTKLIDVAGGTGDIAFEFLQYAKENGIPDCSVTVCDVNEKMLQLGRRRAKSLGIKESDCQWIAGDAMNLPFESNVFDAYTISFGIRNAVDINQVLAEAHRVLKPGGMFLCLEFSSQINNPLIKIFYDWYSFEIIPVIGELVTAQWNSYQYLVESIRKFPDQETFKQMIEMNDFKLVYYDNYLSGMTSIHYGYKPS